MKLSVALMTTVICLTDAIAAETGMTVPIDKQVAQLGRTWQPGVAASEKTYFANAAQIGTELFRYDPVAANAAGLKLLRNLLAKQRIISDLNETSVDIGSADLAGIEEVARSLLAEGNAGIGPQREKVKPFGQFLGRIRAERVAGYVPKTVYRNVSPPPGTQGLSYSGMDPEDIKDPAARKEYEATIRQNRLNVVTNVRQGRRDDMERILARPIVDYLIRIASNDPSSRPLVRQAIIDARLTEAEKAEVLKAMP